MPLSSDPSPSPAGQAGRGRDAPSDLASSAGDAPSDLVYAESRGASLEQKIRDWAGPRPRPMYTPSSVRAVHALHYDWTGWLTSGNRFPGITSELIAATAPLWKQDGLTLKEHEIHGDKTQILFRVTPRVSPSFFAARVKGRLQHAFRQAGSPVKFSRKVSVRTLGENIRAAVEGYLAKQVRKEGFADPRYIRRMQQFTKEIPDIDLAQPSTTNSGRYWYHLHLVLVVEGRVPMVRSDTLATIRDTILHPAAETGWVAKSVSVMPDHVHAALRGDVQSSPEDIALSCLNRLHIALGRNRLWKQEYYVGTFSEYSLDVLRRLP